MTNRGDVGIPITCLMRCIFLASGIRLPHCKSAMLRPMKKRKPKLTQYEQSRRFIEAAREARVDTSDERIVSKVAPKKPAKQPKPK